MALLVHLNSTVFVTSLPIQFEVFSPSVLQINLQLSLPYPFLLLLLLLFFFFFHPFDFSRAAPTAYGGSQARGLIGAVATGLRQSHSNAVSEPCLRPTPQCTATPDP